MRYRLVISDYDGTFRHQDTTIGEKTLSAVRRYVRAGGKFAICTGRMPASICPVLQNAGLKGLYVAYQGSVVAEIESGRIVRESGFTKEQTLRVCGVMQQMGLRIHAYDAENCYTNYRDSFLDAYEEICAIRSVVLDDIYGFIEKAPQKFFKLLAMVRTSERNDVRIALQKALGDGEFYVSCSSTTLVEVTAVQDTKAAAVDFLCGYYDVDRTEVLAFGDNQNDGPMLLAAGHGVAVANADPKLKEIADEVYGKTCDEDAVGDYLERYVLS